MDGGKSLTGAPRLRSDPTWIGLSELQHFGELTGRHPRRYEVTDAARFCAPEPVRAAVAADRTPPTQPESDPVARPHPLPSSPGTCWPAWPGLGPCSGTPGADRCGAPHGFYVFPSSSAAHELKVRAGSSPDGPRSVPLSPQFCVFICWVSCSVGSVVLRYSPPAQKRVILPLGCASR